LTTEIYVLKHISKMDIPFRFVAVCHQFGINHLSLDLFAADPALFILQIH